MMTPMTMSNDHTAQNGAARHPRALPALAFRTAPPGPRMAARGRRHPLQPGERGPAPCPLSGAELRQLVMDTLG